MATDTRTTITNGTELRIQAAAFVCIAALATGCSTGTQPIPTVTVTQAAEAGPLVDAYRRGWNWGQRHYVKVNNDYVDDMAQCRKADVLRDLYPDQPRMDSLMLGCADGLNTDPQAALRS